MPTLQQIQQAFNGLLANFKSHVHNGTDSQKVNFTDLTNAPTFSKSIVDTSNVVTLVGDSTAPGNSYYYGTNSGGTKGFYTLPSGTPGGSNTYVQYNSSSTFAGSSNFTFDGTTVAVYALTASQYLKLPVGTNLYP